MDAIAHAVPGYRNAIFGGNALVSLNKTACPAMDFKGFSTTTTGSGIFVNSGCSTGSNQAFNASTGYSIHEPMGTTPQRVPCRQPAKEGNMPKVKLPPGIQELQGTLYADMVFKRSPQGKITLSKKPDMSKVKPSKAQKVSRARFAASAYAATALAHSEVGNLYRRLAKEQDTFPRNLAISDFYKGKDMLAR